MVTVRPMWPGDGERLQTYIRGLSRESRHNRFLGALNELSPMELARLAQRFPKVNLICGHSGGDWELGVRAVRPHKNILLEFSGSDPHSGMVEYAIKELGVDRLVWGGHGPSRSYATELGKVLDADISRADRMKIFGGNLRRISASIFRKKGMKIEP